MNPESMSTSIQCDDHAETLVFERSICGKDDELLEFSIMDSYIGRREYQGIIGRFRRAWHSFFAKPVYYAGVVVTEKARAITFLNECLAILKSDTGDQQHEQDDAAE